MKRYVLYNENIINNIQTFKDYFGDFLYSKIKIENYNNIISDLKEYPIFTRDAYQKSLYDIIISKKENEETLIINGYSIDYLVFKDKFLLKNNPYLILDSAIFLSKILNIKLIENMIIRKKETYPLSMIKDKELRKKTIKGAFVINKNFKLENSKKINILIIDDVFTTGTTLNEISFEIRKIENIDKIGVLTVARVN